MKNKKGISLIVLVITIIVMTILAGAIIISVSNSGIINQAQEAVRLTNMNQVKAFLDVKWAEIYADKISGSPKITDPLKYVKDALDENQVVYESHGEGILYGGNYITISDTGVKYATLIPEGATYYVGVTSNTIGTFTGAEAIYTAGQTFPTKVGENDMYVYDGYIYAYNKHGSAAGTDSWTSNSTQAGWGVMLADMTKTTCGLILESINDVPVTNAEGALSASSVETLPEGFKIPDSVTSVKAMFAQSSIKALPQNFNIGLGVTDAESMFEGCNMLTNIGNFVVPENVKNITALFVAYQSGTLTGTFTVEGTPESYTACFMRRDISGLTLVGSDDVVAALRATAN